MSHLASFGTEEWLPVSRAARLLDRSPQRIRQLLQSGTLDHASTPLGRLIPRREIERLLTERQQQEEEG